MSSVTPKPMHLANLDRAAVITTAEYVLGGANPPKSEANYYSKAVTEGLLSPTLGPPRDWSVLTGRLKPEEEKRLPEDKALQLQVLEEALREVLAAIESPPVFRNHSLANGIFQLYRRELTWLLGKWIEASGGKALCI